MTWFTNSEPQTGASPVGMMSWSSQHLANYAVGSSDADKPNPRGGSFSINRWILPNNPNASWSERQSCGNMSFVGATAHQFPLGENLVHLVPFNLLTLSDGSLLQLGYG